MTTLSRRKFIKTAGAGGVATAATAVAAPAIAQSMPEVKWRLTASWPKSLDTLYGNPEYLSKRVAELTSPTPLVTPGDEVASKLGPGHYTWEAWAVVDGLDVHLGRRDFEVTLDAPLIDEIAARS